MHKEKRDIFMKGKYKLVDMSHMACNKKSKALLCCKTGERGRELLLYKKVKSLRTLPYQKKDIRQYIYLLIADLLKINIDYTHNHERNTSLMYLFNKDYSTRTT